MATTKITNPDLFDLGSLDSALKLPSGTTAERPTSPSTGEWRYNTTNNNIEFYDGSGWVVIADQDIPPVPSENFNVVLYDGTSATHAITGVGFQPDLVWIKDRNNAEQHILNDSTRGATKDLSTNTSAAEATRTTGFLSFDSDGFTLGTDGGGVVNDSARGPYVAWCFKANGGNTSSNTDGTITSTVQANTRAGFSIVNYQGAGGSSSTVGHGLSSAPELIIVKGTQQTSAWPVYSSGLSAASKYMYLNTDGAETSASNPDEFDSTAPTSTVFSIGFSGNTNLSGSNFIAYCFHSVSGYSKFGSYTGNGSSSGPIINTGFEPAWVMVKGYSNAGSWWIWDNKRNTTNPRNNILRADTNGAEVTNTTYDVNFLSNGFQLIGTNTDVNGSGRTYIYMAFASDPSTAPVLADSFDVDIYTGDGTSNRVINTVGFRPDFYWLKTRDSSGCTYNNWFDTLRGGNKTIYSNATDAEVTNQGCGYIQSFDSSGVTYTGDASGINNNNEDFVYWTWKANPIPTINTDGTIQSVVSVNQAAGFSIIKYTGDGSTSATIGHGLSATPELIITKNLEETRDWRVFHTDLSTNQYLTLNTTGAVGTAPTNTCCGAVASVGATTFGFVAGNTSSTELDNVNKSGIDYISYCFHSVSGYSKFGSYTGDGGTQAITGLGFSPNCVIVKSVTFAEVWSIFDTARGPNKRLTPSGADQEYTNSGGGYLQSFDSDGFTVQPGSSSASNVNKNGETYIYLAWKENPTPQPLAGYMSFLVVAGGGSGGNENARSGGGAGAGGLRTSYGSTSGGGASAESDITLAAGTYTITVGAGGAGQSSTPSAGNDGSLSSIAASYLTTISSVGGGGGGAPGTGRTGGSGGGGAHGGNAGGSGTANQGFAGGSGNGESPYNGAGGGGASAVGANSSAGGGSGAGGNGLSVSITGSATAYAGGGGGGGGTAASGGTGGGGSGSTTSAGGATVNTGGGGGGARTGSGAGGSGVVILRLATSEYSGTTTGSPTVTTDGDYTILTYTGSGTYVHS